MLNACPRCQRTFPAEEGRFCPADATPLEPIDQVTVPKDPDDPRVGAVIANRFELRRVIADGGMGRVFEARDKETQRRVAVKILHPDIADDEVNIERFRREASTSSNLDHAHIVEVVDFSVTELPGTPKATRGWYLVMEYLDGEELRTVLRRDVTVPLGRMVRMVAQLAQGLDPAHRKGFVHRDIKPDNVFLVRRPDGDLVKVLDFGSVKFTKGQDRGNKLTVMGTTIGSPYYMSPEQAQGSADLDHRADVWAIGVMIYEMSVGKVPFNAPNGPQILFKILGDEPLPPTMASDSVPPMIDDVVLRALAKKPAERYQSCSQLADALGRALGLEGDHTVWASTPEQELQARIERFLAPKSKAPPPVETAQGSLGGPSAPEKIVSMPAGPSPTFDGPLQVPMEQGSMTKWIVIGVLVVGVLLGAALGLR